MRRLAVIWALWLSLDACSSSVAPTASIAAPTGPVPVGLSVSFDGRASQAGNGAALVYAWRLTSAPAGSEAWLRQANAAVAVLVPDLEGAYSVELVVGDGVLTASARASLEVACGAASPVVAIDPPPAINAVGRAVSLSAQVTDADANAPCSLPQSIETQWAFEALPAGSRAELVGETGLAPSFVPDVGGTYRVTAMATDSTGRVGRASIDVIVSACGARAPEIQSLSASAAAVGVPVQLSAQAADPDEEAGCGLGARLSSAWRLTSLPAGSHARFNDPALLAPSFVPDVAGRYEAELVLADDTGRTATKRLTIDAATCGSNAPSVKAVTTTGTQVGSPVRLSAEVDDADRACGRDVVLSYAWRLTALPAGSVAKVVDGARRESEFVPDVAGRYAGELVLTDETGRRVSAPFAVDVGVCGTAIPAIAAITATPAGLGSPTRLAVDASDADFDCGAMERLSYAWSLTKLPAGSSAMITGADVAAPWFVPDVAGAYEASVSVRDAAGHVARASVAVEVGACGANAPVIVATTASEASINAPVQLAGEANDPDAECRPGDVLSYVWNYASLPAGSRATLTGAATARPWFIPDVVGTYELAVEVVDGSGRLARSAVTVDVGACGSNTPKVDAISAGAASIGLPVGLSVTASDADDLCGRSSPLTYTWSLSSLPQGSRAVLSDPSVTQPWFTPDVVGQYEARVVVRDATGRTARSTVTVDADACGSKAPVVTAVEAASNGLGNAARLSVAATDPDATCGRGGTLTYAWTMRALPAGSLASLSDASIAAPSFVPDVEGRYEIEVVVGDGSGLFAIGIESVDVGPCGANPPAITAIGASAASIDQPVQLTATASDPDAVCSGAPALLGWWWRFLDLPVGSVAAIDDPSRPSPSFVPDEPGTYTVELTVIDTSGRTASRTTRVEVSGCGGFAPVVTGIVSSRPQPGVGQALSLRAEIQDGDESSECGFVEAYTLSWRLAALPAGSLARITPANALVPTLTPDVPGAYVVEVVATDRSGRASFPARLSVEASSCGAHVPAVTLDAPAQANVGGLVHVRATTSDADNDPAGCALPQGSTVVWSFAAVPAGSHARLEAASGTDPWFVPDVEGEYEIRAYAIDASGLQSVPASALVRVSTCGGRAPAVTAAADPAQANALQIVRLTAAVTDADNDPGCALGQTFTYAWSMAAVPAGSRAGLVGLASSSPWFVPDLAGRYAARVVVTDSTGRSTTSDVEVEAGGCGLAAPVVTARASAVTPAAGANVALIADVTDADSAAPCSLAQTFSYAWSFLELPAGSRARLAGGSLASASVIADLPGRYVALVTVTDGAGKTGAATVSFEATTCGRALPEASLAGASSSSVGQRVVVSGSASDADTNASCGRVETFVWRWDFAALPAGSGATISGTTSQAAFVPDVPGAYLVRAVVLDAAGHASAPAVHAVTVSNCGAASPVAQFTPPAAARVGGLVTLASGSSDPDAAAPCSQAGVLTHAWIFSSLPGGSRAVIGGAATAVASFVPDVAGRYGVRLVVTDGTGRSSTLEADVVADACGAHVPVAQVSSAPASIAPAMPVTLSASVTDEDNDVACAALGTPAQSFAYQWQLLSMPAGSRAALSSPAAAAPVFTPDVPGSYVARLVVTDATGRVSAPVEHRVTVGACGTSAPTATASATPTSAALGQSVALAATYVDADESAACVTVTGAPASVRYAWRLTAAPSGSRAILSNAGTASPALVPDVAGRYVAAVTVSDATGRAGEAAVEVTVSGCGGSAPAGSPALASGQTLAVGSAVVVRSNATDADNAAPCSRGQTLSYAWSLVEAPAGSRASMAPASAQDASFTPDVAGRYVASVQVTDSTGRAATLAPVVVTVGGCGGATPVPAIKLTSPSTTGASSALTVEPVLSCRFQFDASESQDADAACGLPQGVAELQYRWEQVSAPVGSSKTLSSTTQVAPWSDLDLDGAYQYRLWVSDGTHVSAVPATARIVHRGFSITGVSPAVSCAGAAVSNVVLTAAGQGFLRVTATSTLPTVTISNGATVSSRTLSNCTTTGMPAGLESCTTMTLGVSNASSAGNYTVTVTNPLRDGCAAQAVFSIAEAPTVNTVSPTKVCAADPLVPSVTTLAITGQKFVANTNFSLGSSASVLSSISSDTDASVAFTLPSTPGLYSVSASNGTGCSGIPPFPSLNVVAQPIAYSVDPPVLYNGITTVATVYASGLSASNVPTGILIRPAGSSADPTSLAFTYDGSSVFTQGRVQVVVPSGLQPGEWEVSITDSNSCASKSVKALKITNSLGLALGSIDPPFGGSTVAMAVDLRITSPLPSGKEAFTAGQPRVYLNPTAGGGNALALNTVTVVNSGLANAVVKAGLAAGTYDVIAVNPSGQVGVLRNAFRVLSVPPPVIDAIVPGSVPAGSAATITVRGTGFSSPTARLDCVGAAGGSFSLAAPVSASTSTTVTTTAPALTAGDLCVYVVINSDGSYAEFSALGVTGASLNLGAFVANSSLVTGRRYPATTYGRPTRTARFLYAIGGDNGAIGEGRQFASIEAASLDRYGNLGAWRTLPVPLPAGRTFTTAVTIGKFIYLPGGDLGLGPTNTVLRAKILDPGEAPTVTDAALGFAANALGPGAWSYRVAAVMQVADAENPSGEGLPSDAFIVNVPTGLPSTVTPLLSWTEVTGAASYRIYRSPTANAASGTEKLVATVTAPTTSWTDTGDAAAGASARALGDLGAWASIGNMGVAHSGAGIAYGVDPSDARKAYLYVMAGLSSSGVADASYEYLPITINPTTGAQTLGAWARVTTTGLTGRWQSPVFTVTDVVTSRITPGDTWLHLGSGLLGNGSVANNVDAARVQAGGTLSAFTAERSPTNYSGYGYAAAADQLFIFGGSGGPATGGRSTVLNATPPGTGNWNAGIGLNVARQYQGSVVESARIFQIGGATSGGVVTNTVESVVW